MKKFWHKLVSWVKNPYVNTVLWVLLILVAAGVWQWYETFVKPILKGE